MAIAWDVFDVRDKQLQLDALKNLMVLDFSIADGETTRKLLFEQFN